jgi:hypothetical protein
MRNGIHSKKNFNIDFPHSKSDQGSCHIQSGAGISQGVDGIGER